MSHKNYEEELSIREVRPDHEEIKEGLTRSNQEVPGLGKNDRKNGRNLGFLPLPARQASPPLSRETHKNEISAREVGRSILI
jgi:hypothetical protein